MDNSNIIVWDDSVKLGIKQIDAQHCKLVDMCNTLHSSIVRISTENRSDWQLLLYKTLNAAAEYSREHFSYEERLMQLVGYEAYEAHKAIHREFIQKISDVMARFNSLTLQDVYNYADYIKDWVRIHIAHEDRGYCPVVLRYHKLLQQKKATAAKL